MGFIPRLSDFYAFPLAISFHEMEFLRSGFERITHTHTTKAQCWLTLMIFRDSKNPAWNANGVDRLYANSVIALVF